MRGEYHCACKNNLQHVGSPPLARGIRGIGVPPGAQPGDHPRLRGEYMDWKTGRMRLTGSPPLARGIPILTVGAERPIRITPACAGNTMVQGTTYKPFEGSPPLARGILVALEGMVSPDGITPACAGNTRRYSDFLLRLWDHPRLRGEYYNHVTPPPGCFGSPPLARGIPEEAIDRRYQTRITPACAGNTGRNLWCRDTAGDHPRLRGEY